MIFFDTFFDKFFDKPKPSSLRYFNPQRDITAYELALIVNMFEIRRAELQIEFMEAHPELERHFSDQPNIPAIGKTWGHIPRS
jgi:hypothetical protein